MKLSVAVILSASARSDSSYIPIVTLKIQSTFRAHSNHQNSNFLNMVLHDFTFSGAEWNSDHLVLAFSISIPNIALVKQYTGIVPVS